MRLKLITDGYCTRVLDAILGKVQAHDPSIPTQPASNRAPRIALQLTILKIKMRELGVLP